MADDGNCGNCGLRDYVVDYARGSVACAGCGACRDMALLVGGGGRAATVPYESYANGAYHENFDDAVAEAMARLSNSPPYRRETYFSERISQVGS